MKLLLTCADFAQLAAHSLDTPPTRRQRLAMWLHTAICGPCQHHQEQLAATVSLIRESDTRRPPCPKHLRDNLLNAFKQDKPSDKR